MKNEAWRWALIQPDSFPYKRRLGHRYAQRDSGWRPLEKDSVDTPGRKASGEIGPAHAWTSDSQPPESGDNAILWFKTPLCVLRQS